MWRVGQNSSRVCCYARLRPAPRRSEQVEAPWIDAGAPKMNYDERPRPERGVRCGEVSSEDGEATRAKADQGEQGREARGVRGD